MHVCPWNHSGHATQINEAAGGLLATHTTSTCKGSLDPSRSRPTSRDHVAITVKIDLSFTPLLVHEITNTCTKPQLVLNHNSLQAARCGKMLLEQCSDGTSPVTAGVQPGNRPHGEPSLARPAWLGAGVSSDSLSGPQPLATKAGWTRPSKHSFF